MQDNEELLSEVTNCGAVCSEKKLAYTMKVSSEIKEALNIT